MCRTLQTHPSDPVPSLAPLLVALAGLEGHLQDLVSEPVAVEAGDGHRRLLVVCHGDEAEALTLAGVEVSDHLDVGDGAEGAEHLPQDALVGVLAQVVDEDAPAGGGAPGNADAPHAAHVIHTHGGEPERDSSFTQNRRVFCNPTTTEPRLSDFITGLLTERKTTNRSV